jgi:CheY-like chemotaxis protein
VLVVDDEPPARMTTADMLENPGYETVEVGDARLRGLGIRSPPIESRAIAYGFSSSRT